MTGDSAGGGRVPASLGAGEWRVDWHDALGSTNAEALAQARAGDPGRLWVVAERQTEGRGRRGRVWTSEPGNLYASALLVDPCPIERLAELPFVAAVAVRAAVAAHAGHRAGDVAIKWPNDLMIAGRKVSGMLLESAQVASGVMAVAIGIGINCRQHPFGTETPATSLLGEGIGVLPEILMRDLAGALAVRLDRWAAGAGFAEIRAEWLAHAVGIGGPVRVRLIDSEDHGRFEAIDEAGRLVLVRDDGERRLVSAGDVFFPDRGGSGVK